MRNCCLLFALLAGLATPDMVMAQKSPAPHTTNQVNVAPQSGLVIAEGYNMVAAHCSACHSPSLITQNAMSRERWLETIRWMQDTQKLWPLGDAEPTILDYLATWYGPKPQSRRPPLAPHLMPKP